MSEVVSAEESSWNLPHWLRRSGRFDDRLDIETDLTFGQSLIVMRRSLRLLRNRSIWPLFLGKFALALGLSFLGITLPWVLKVIPDHVILGIPIDEATVNFPDFMWPMLNLLQGLEPLEIMSVLTVTFVVVLVLFGLRAGGTGGGLYGGRDAAGQAENAITEGYSDGSGIWGIVEWWVNVRLTQRLTNTLRTILFQRIVDLPMVTLHDQRAGDSVYRVLYDTPEVQRLCFALTFWPFFMVFTLVVTLYVLENTYATVNAVVVWAAMAILPLTLLITVPASALMRRVHQSRRAAGSATTNALEESVENMADIQSLGGAEFEKVQFELRSALAFFKERNAIAVGVFILVLICIAAAISAVYVFIVVSNEVMNGALTPGDFFVLVGLFLELAFISAEIGAFWVSLQEHIPAVRRVFFLIDQETDSDRHGSRLIETIREGITLDNVTFGYEAEKPLFRNVTLNLEIGSFVAILGATGTGKTTFAQLLPGFIEPQEGSILVDGLNVNDISCRSLRGQVSYIFQEHSFYGDTIRMNLLLANPLATDSEMLEVLERAQCREFIEKLPNGIDTQIGKTGNALSVGQQQRVSIARGLLRNSPVLILDEPTADLDPVTERALVDALIEGRENHLLIMISHRPSTIRLADQFIVLQDGKVESFDSYEEIQAAVDV